VGGLRCGIDNYGLFPLGLDPLATLQWAHAHGAAGVQFSGLDPAHPAALDDGYLDELRGLSEDTGLYLEWGGAGHIPRDMTTWAARDLFEVNRRAAAQAMRLGARVVRSCSGGLMRWDGANPDTAILLEESAACLLAQRSMLRDHGVVLGLETHFEFTTFELLALFEHCEAEPGEWLGVCLDTMNLLTLLEDPWAATARILPWTVATHIKDGAVRRVPGGLESYPTAVGEGVIDLAGIVRRLATRPGGMNLSVEDHGGSFFIPVDDPDFRARFPDLTDEELASLHRLADRTGERMATGGCRPTLREEWPAVCEERLAGDLERLKILVAETVGPGYGEV
jgi:sugar phosphate isomerase/epimerase